MDVIRNEAVGVLTQAIEALLPPPENPSLRPRLLVAPLDFVPTGLGGFVGMNGEPFGEIHGRRVRARAHVIVRAANAAGVPGAVNAVVRALVTADRSISGGGYFVAKLHDLAPHAPQASEREVVFDVDFEYLKRPDEAGGILEEIPLDVDTDETGRSAVLFDIPFMETSFDWFEVVDDAAATHNRPSRWRYQADAESIEQTSSIWGGGPGSSANKPGTYAVLRTASGRPQVADFVLRSSLQSDSGRGIGVVFRWQDPNNFYFFLMDDQASYRRLAKKTNGIFAELDTGAVAPEGYDVAETYRLKLRAVGSAFTVWLNEEVVLTGSDAAIPGPGRIGFMCHRNNDAHFFSLQVREA